MRGPWPECLERRWRSGGACVEISIGVECTLTAATVRQRSSPRPATRRVDIRDAHPDDIDQLARLWFDGWHDAHARLLPPELVRDRNPERLRVRLEQMLPRVRVAGARGAPLGFHVVEGDELNQLYVAANSRGTGVAAALV